MTGVLSVLQHVRAGTLRGLGVSTIKRLAVAPEIPAIAETVKDFEASQWYASLRRPHADTGPATTPQRDYHDHALG